MKNNLIYCLFGMFVWAGNIRLLADHWLATLVNTHPIIDVENLTDSHHY